MPESLPNPESVAGEGPVEGFILSLPPVRDRLKSPQLMIKANSQDVAALRRKNFVELCDPVRGLVEDIEFRRNLSTARPLDL